MPSRTLTCWSQALPSPTPRTPAFPPAPACWDSWGLMIGWEGLLGLSWLDRMIHSLRAVSLGNGLRVASALLGGCAHMLTFTSSYSVSASTAKQTWCTAMARETGTWLWPAPEILFPISTLIWLSAGNQDCRPTLKDLRLTLGGQNIEPDAAVEEASRWERKVKIACFLK